MATNWSPSYAPYAVQPGSPTTPIDIGTISSGGIPNPSASADAQASPSSTSAIRNEVSTSRGTGGPDSFNQVEPAVRPSFAQISSQSAGRADGANCRTASGLLLAR